MDPAAPLEEGAYRFCPTCGTASVPGQTKCHSCGRLVRIPRKVWVWVVGIAGVLEALWALIHGRSAVEVVASAIGFAVLIGLTAWILVRNLSKLNRRGGPSKALGAVTAMVVTAALCLPILTALDREGESTLFVFSIGLLLVPLIGIPAGVLLARGSRTHVPLHACKRCETYGAPNAAFCVGCGKPLETELR